MTEAHQVPPEAEEVPADSTPATPDPSVSGLPDWLRANLGAATAPVHLRPHRPWVLGIGAAVVKVLPDGSLTWTEPSGTWTDVAAQESGVLDTPPAVPSYLEMFEEYLAGQEWIGAAETPLVFHLKRLCAQLDRDPLAPAAVSSAYLQAFSRLDRRRPGAPSGPGVDPDQTTIFDHLDD